MGSEYNSDQNFAAIIKEALDNGRLTRAEATRRLELAIERELAKDPAEIRNSFINTCEDLLYALNAQEEYVSRSEISKRQLEEKLFRARKSHTFSKRLALIVSIAIVLVVGIIALDGTMYRKWLTGESSEDIQQYEVSGHVVDPNLVEKGNANPNDEFREISTTSIDEVLGFLSYTPLLPKWYPDGWEVDEYFASSDGSLEWFVVTLTSSNEPTHFIVLEISHYSTVEMAQASIEQNQHGYHVSCNGWEVYFTENIDRPVAVWFEGTSVYVIHGPVTQDDIVKIIESIDR